MAEVEIRNVGTQPVRVGDEVIPIGAVRRVAGNTLSVSNTEPPPPPEPTDDVFSPGNRPNGPMSAAIAPKLPKASGELVQVPVPGAEHLSMERAAAEPGQATQGGGPESKDTVTTPGPKVDTSVVTPPEAVGTGAADLRGDRKDVSAPVKKDGRAQTRAAGTSATKRAAKGRRR
jgi:hypothetical protein